MSAEDLYNQLISDGIVNSIGKAKFELNGIETVIKDSSVVGNIIQDWLKEYLIENKTYFRPPENSQNFPDFYLDENSNTKGLLEVKCFRGSPNFDVANFKAYARSLLTNCLLYTSRCV